jgi:transcriptional regulator with PAS, ATPase and Fis domain
MICRATPGSGCDGEGEPQPFVTHDDEARETLQLVGSVAATDATILIEGESGTGKELLARRVHRLSPRRSRELVSISCAALPAGLLESELFGHERGAFTGAFTRVIGKFELAHGTTILLDEIGELEIHLQSKLLRVLQEKQVQRLGARRPVAADFRLVATTNRELADEVRAGRFRADLYYRLNVIPIRLTPLRERPDDVPLLLEHFLEHHARRGRALPRFEPEAIAALRQHAWPGNVRELENLVERLVLTLGGCSVRRAELGLPAPAASAGVEPSDAPFRTLREMERWLIVETLAQLRGNRTRAAERLGIGLRTLRNKIRDHEITEPATLPQPRRAGAAWGGASGAGPAPGVDRSDRARYPRKSGSRARRRGRPQGTLLCPPELRPTRPEL